ncbi:MAG: hypothetical protein E7D47_07655, partial [Veillonella sp.]|nr:hypothetical protein [Veillonella sp.]
TPTLYLSKVIFLYNFRCRTRIAGGFMIRDYVANQSKDNNKKALTITANASFIIKILQLPI